MDQQVELDKLHLHFDPSTYQKEDLSVPVKLPFPLTISNRALLLNLYLNRENKLWVTLFFLATEKIPVVLLLHFQATKFLSVTI